MKRAAEISGQTPALRKISLWLLCLFSAILIVGLIALAASNISEREKQWCRNVQIIEGELSELDLSLSDINLYLTDLLLNSEDIKFMRRESDIQRCNAAARQLSVKMAAQNRGRALRCNFFFFLPEQNVEAFAYDGASSYSECMDLRQLIKDRLQKRGQVKTGFTWTPVKAGSTVYLMQCYQLDGALVAGWAPCGSALSFLDGQAGYEIRDADGELLACGGGLEESPEHSWLTEDFTMRYGDITLKAMDRPGERFGTQLSIILFMAATLLVVAAFSVYTIRYFQRYIQEPFKQMQDHIDNYVQERKSAKRKGFAELDQATAAFDSLIRQLNQLKIEQYEEKIALSRTQLEFFQLQIKPHFFVNSFSIIHGMAQKKDFGRIQDFCLKLSEYMRYLFRDGLTTATLEEELKAVEDYLGIQDIRYRVHSVMNREIPESLMQFQLPPVLLLTFVENAVKHARGDLSELIISIRAVPFRRESGRFVLLCVSSNSSSFSAETLEALNSPAPEEDDNSGRHLGIQNARRRLSLMYGDEYELHFCNDGGSSTVEITLPDRGDFSVAG